VENPSPAISISFDRPCDNVDPESNLSCDVSVGVGYCDLKSMCITVLCYSDLRNKFHDSACSD
jgi:hypothetical protein